MWGDTVFTSYHTGYESKHLKSANIVVREIYNVNVGVNKYKLIKNNISKFTFHWLFYETFLLQK